MQVYACKVLLGGNGQVTTHVRKEVTAPELILLRMIHGADWVTDISPIKMDNREHDGERQRLKETYGAALRKMDPPTSIDQVFGQSFNKLPVRAPDVKAPAELDVG